jgi:hypothetical protein
MTTQYPKSVSLEMTYHFSIKDIRDEVIKALIRQYGGIIETLQQKHDLETKVLHDEINKLRGNEQIKFEELKKLLIQFLKRFPAVKNKKQVAEKMADNLILKNLKPEIEIGYLATYSDGTIGFKGSVIPIRDQLNDLCRMFMSRPNQLVLCDEIRDEIVRAERRERTRFSTIAKYVSELHGLLKPCFGKDVILNHKKEGWRFVP